MVANISPDVLYLIFLNQFVIQKIQLHVNVRLMVKFFSHFFLLSVVAVSFEDVFSNIHIH